MEVQKKVKKKPVLCNALSFSYELSLWLRSDHTALLPHSPDNTFAPEWVYCVQQHFVRQHTDIQIDPTHPLQEPEL